MAVVQFRDTDRAADGAAEFVADQVRSREVGRVLAGLGDTEVVVARGFEHRRVDPVGAGLGGQDDGCGSGKLRTRVHRLEAGFLHRIRIRKGCLGSVRLTAEVAVGHRSAVLRVFHTFAHQAVGAGSAGFQAGDRVLRQSENVAAVLGELVDAAGVELRADNAAVIGCQLHGFGADGNLFGNIANRELGVENNNLAVLDLDRGLVLLHARGGEGDCVGAGEQSGNRVEARSVCVRVVCDGGSLVDDVDGAVGNSSSG